jgi:hypothetical protein
MATFWFETCVEGYFWWKLPVGRQFKSLKEYSPLLYGKVQPLKFEVSSQYCVLLWTLACFYFFFIELFQTCSGLSKSFLGFQGSNSLIF